MSEDLTKIHIRKVLEACARWQDAFKAKVEELEAAGRRIVDAGQVGAHHGNDGADWEVTDWRTGEVIASGRGDFEAFSTALNTLDPTGQWALIDGLMPDVDATPVTPTPGLPESLAAALQEWAEHRAEPDELAAWVGWSVERVEQCLSQEPHAVQAA
jgi:hypothetical protein